MLLNLALMHSGTDSTAMVPPNIHTAGVSHLSYAIPLDIAYCQYHRRWPSDIRKSLLRFRPSYFSLNRCKCCHQPLIVDSGMARQPGELMVVGQFHAGGPMWGAVLLTHQTQVQRPAVTSPDHESRAASQLPAPVAPDPSSSPNLPQ